MNNLSLCMIVKNEEIALYNCLDAITKYVSEIVIVDTGSEDKTKTIASQFTDKVYDFSWCDDFSKARNFCIDKASNDWIFVLDADEITKTFNTENVNGFLNKDESIIGEIEIINFYEDNKGLKTSKERVGRLFNKRYFHYEGIIHEQIIPYNSGEYKILPVEIVINHNGYSKKVIDTKDKIKRNLELIKQAILKNPKDPYLYYQMGKSYFMGKEYLRASQSFNTALLLGADVKYGYVEDLVETYGYALINNGEYDKALKLEVFNKFYGMLPDYNFIMGLIYMNNGRLSQAVTRFMQCIGNLESKVEGINSYLSYYNIGVIYECLGFDKQAAEYYKCCGDYEPALKQLRKLCYTR